MRPVIGPRPRPRRPFKSSGLAFEAYGIVNVKAAFVVFDSTYLLNLVAALDWASVTVATIAWNSSGERNGRESKSEGSEEVHCLKSCWFESVLSPSSHSWFYTEIYLYILRWDDPMSKWKWKWKILSFDIPVSRLFRNTSDAALWQHIVFIVQDDHRIWIAYSIFIGFWEAIRPAVKILYTRRRFRRRLFSSVKLDTLDWICGHGAEIHFLLVRTYHLLRMSKAIALTRTSHGVILQPVEIMRSQYFNISAFRRHASIRVPYTLTGYLRASLMRTLVFIAPLTATL